MAEKNPMKPTPYQEPEDKDKTEHAEKSLEAANEAARTVSNLYIPFLLLGTYIGVIIASTTSEQLLRGIPVTLPLLDVQLPIVQFYKFVPFLFLLFHFNLLFQFALLARKLRVFDRFAANLPDEENTALKERLFNFPFVHMLIDQRRDGFMRWVLAMIVYLTMIALPVLLLLWTQIMFVRYHSEGSTWLHRTAVLVDTAILGIFWARIMSSRNSAIHWWKQRGRQIWFWFDWSLSWFRALGRLAGRKPWHAPKGFGEAWGDWRTEASDGAEILITVISGSMLASFLIVTVPNEPLEEFLTTHMPEKWLCEWTHESSARRAFLPTYYLFHGKHGPFRRDLQLREKILTANTLPPKVINSLRGHGEKQGFQEILGINLQGRDLRYAQLSQCILPKADLRGANLQGANLKEAHLQGVKFNALGDEEENSGADLRNAFLDKADLRGANLDKAKLAGAKLSLVRLEKTDLQRVNLQGVKLKEAKLQGANLMGTILNGADLGGAYLQGAVLDGTYLLGANLAGAWLQGSDLRGAQLQGANLGWAQLQGSDLNAARLEGSDLRGAQLQGADLGWAQLQGSDLSAARLDGSDLRGASMGGAIFQETCFNVADLRGLDLTTPNKEQYAELSKQLELLLNDAGHRKRILERFQANLDRKSTLNEATSAERCLTDEPALLSRYGTKTQPAEYNAALTTYLVELACKDPDIARGIARRALTFKELATALLEADCKAIMELPQEIKSQLPPKE
ncbi:MAG: pentapeptide repeat-containing protein [Desulfobacteraceae bacterium]|nr:pentapeptide repeat-containing protein [Desulfobacteraceae bacterium]